MCEFISWIEKEAGGKKYIFFLTSNDIYNTKRGRELQAFCGTSRDYVGHGSIEFFYPEAKGGKHLECEDFSSTKNFPEEVVVAIKVGAFRGMGVMMGVLLAPAQAEYKKVCNAIWAEYEKVCNATWAAWAECRKVRDAAFWDLFAVVENRREEWR